MNVADPMQIFAAWVAYCTAWSDFQRGLLHQPPQRDNFLPSPSKPHLRVVTVNGRLIDLDDHRED